MPDALTGLATEDPERQTATDYLGRESPVSLSAKPSLPVGGVPAGVATGPQATSTGIVPPGGSTDPTGATGGSGAGGGAAAGSDLAKVASILSLLGKGNQLSDFASRLFRQGTGPAGLPFSELSNEGHALAEASGGELALNNEPFTFGMFGDPASQVSGGELALGAGEAAGAGADAAGAISTGLGAIGEAAPIWGLLTSAVDLIGEGKFPLEGLLNSIFGFDDPSKAWTTFPSRVAGTLQGTETANQSLAQALASASGEGGVEKAIADWKAQVGGVVPGFGAGSGALEIPGEPGAGHGRHEGRGLLAADFSPELEGLRAEMQAALSGATPEDRIKALMKAAQGRRDTLAAEKAATDAEQHRLYDWSDAAVSANTGSA